MYRLIAAMVLVGTGAAFGGEGDDKRDKEIAELRDLVSQLTVRLQTLENKMQIIEQVEKRVTAIEQRGAAPAVGMVRNPAAAGAPPAAPTPPLSVLNTDSVLMLLRLEDLTDPSMQNAFTYLAQGKAGERYIDAALKKVKHESITKGTEVKIIRRFTNGTCFVQLYEKGAPTDRHGWLLELHLSAKQ